MNAMFTGLLFGVAVAAPVGPIGLLCLRRTLAGGFFIGFASGLGAACADGAYAAGAVIALSAVTVLLAHLAVALHIAGGAALIVLGLRGLWNATRAAAASAPGSAAARPLVAFASTLALTIVNPATIVSFAAIVAASGGRITGGAGGLLFALGVMLGSAAWWLVLCGGAAALRRAVTPRLIRTIDALSAAAFIISGTHSLVSR